MELGAYSVSCWFKNSEVKTFLSGCFKGYMGRGEWEDFCLELCNIRRHWNGLWCIGGNRNVVCFLE